jgi:hypothetical protein
MPAWRPKISTSDGILERQSPNESTAAALAPTAHLRGSTSSVASKSASWAPVGDEINKIARCAPRFFLLLNRRFFICRQELRRAPSTIVVAVAVAVAVAIVRVVEDRVREVHVGGGGDDQSSVRWASAWITGSIHDAQAVKSQRP